MLYQPQQSEGSSLGLRRSWRSQAITQAIFSSYLSLKSTDSCFDWLVLLLMLGLCFVCFFFLSFFFNVFFSSRTCVGFFVLNFNPLTISDELSELVSVFKVSSKQLSEILC